jgi:hypothetical protein
MNIPDNSWIWVGKKKAKRWGSWGWTAAALLPVEMNPGA